MHHGRVPDVSTMTPATAPAHARRRRGRLTAVEAFAVLAAAGLIAVILTWPLAANFGSLIVGGGSAGDNTGYIWDLWTNARHGLDLWGGGLQDTIGVPFGRPIIGGANLLLLFYVGPGWLLASAFSAVVAYNVLALAGMALTGASMYLLVRWLGLGMAPAAWAGMAFEIFPYEVIRIGAHIPLAQLAFMPLLVMAAVFWLQGPTLRRAVLLATAVLFAWLSNPYFGAIALVGAGVTFVVGAVMVGRASGLAAMGRRLAELAAALIVLVAFPLVLVLAAARGTADRLATRQVVELEIYGAHISDYIKPPPGAFLMTGIFGGAEHWPVVSPGGERTAFLGWTVILIAIGGLVLAWRFRDRLRPRERTALLLCVPLAFVMGVFSLASPTRWFGLEIPMPSSIVFDYLPFLRVYARFGLAVMAAVLVIGAVGLSLAIRGRSITWRASLTSAAIILTAMELPISMPLATGVPLTIDGQPADRLPTWHWLATHDPGVAVIETPAFPNEVLDRAFLYGQMVHGHPLANGGLNEPNTTSDFGREYGNPLFPASATAYATAGIRYVVINPWAWGQSGLTPPAAGSPPPGYRVAAAFPGGGGVWRVTAASAPAIAFPGTGWWDPETVNGVRWRYLKDTATVVAYAPVAAPARISFEAKGFLAGRDYMLTVDPPLSKTLTFPVSGRRRISFTTRLPAGTSTFRLVASGTPAQQVSPKDLRVVSVDMSQWTVS